MSDLQPDTTYVADTLALIAQQYQQQPASLPDLLTAFTNRCQELETAMFPLLTLLDIADSFGVQLDAIGKIVGQARSGLTDVAYRQRLFAAIYLDRISGTLPQILLLMELLESQSAVIVESFPAAFKCTLSSPVSDGLVIAPMLQQAKPAGVKAVLEFQSFPTTQLFSWFGFTGLGWDENGTGVGGFWADAVETE